jgi:hypothetical protein
VQAYLDGSAPAQGAFLTRISEHQDNLKGQQTSEPLDKLGSG